MIVSPRTTLRVLTFAASIVAVSATGASWPLSPTPLAAQGRGIDVVLDSALLAGYRWRNIGPDRGGRSIAVSGVKGRPDEAYFGAVG